MRALAATLRITRQAGRHGEPCRVTPANGV